MSSLSPFLRETLATLRAAGFKPQVEQSRHIKMRFIDARGCKRLIVLSRTPGTPFALQKNRALVRRLLRRPTPTAKE